MINIDEIYSIDVDKYNYILIKDEKRLNKKGEMVFKTIGYYPSLESAISACAEQYERDAFSENELSLCTKPLNLSDRREIDSQTF